jgi:glycosyl transferase family 25
MTSVVPEIFVINLVTSAARRANITRQLADLGLAFTLFPAVDGRKEEHRLFGKYDNERNQHYRGQALSRGQLGCYASHYLLWQECVELDHPVVVLEDDALIYPEPFSEFVNNLDALRRRFDCVRLFDNKRKAFSSRRVAVLDTVEIHRFNKGHMSTTGYFLTPNGARKLLQHSEHWYMPVDHYLDRYWVNGVECYGTVPACVTNDPKFDSDIGGGEREPRSFVARCRREWFNFNELTRRTLHNFSTARQSKD